MTISIEIILALIGIVGAYITGARATKNEYVLKDREKWRDYLREWVKNFSNIPFANKDSLKEARDDLRTRTNPIMERDLIVLLNRMIESKSKDEYTNIRHIIVTYFTEILKNEWERTKDDSTVIGFKTYFDVVTLFLVFWVFVIEITKSDLQVFNVNDFDVSILLISLYFFTKIFGKIAINGFGIKSIIYPNYLVSLENIKKKYSIEKFDLSNEEHIDYILDENKENNVQFKKRRNVALFNFGLMLILIVIIFLVSKSWPWDLI